MACLLATKILLMLDTYLSGDLDSLHEYTGWYRPSGHLMPCMKSCTWAAIPKSRPRFGYVVV
jgi:hypothetical protein